MFGVRCCSRRCSAPSGSSSVPRPLALEPSTFLIGIAAGHRAAPSLAAWFPARRASRIPPVAALRDDATIPHATRCGSAGSSGASLLALGVARAGRRCRRRRTRTAPHWSGSAPSLTLDRRHHLQPRPGRAGVPDDRRSAPPTSSARWGGWRWTTRPDSRGGRLPRRRRSMIGLGAGHRDSPSSRPRPVDSVNAADRSRSSAPSSSSANRHATPVPAAVADEIEQIDGVERWSSRTTFAAARSTPVTESHGRQLRHERSTPTTIGEVLDLHVHRGVLDDLDDDDRPGRQHDRRARRPRGRRQRHVHLRHRRRLTSTSPASTSRQGFFSGLHRHRHQALQSMPASRSVTPSSTSRPTTGADLDALRASIEDDPRRLPDGRRAEPGRAEGADPDAASTSAAGRDRGAARVWRSSSRSSAS